MAWVRLDDHMDEHDKVLALEDDAPEAMWMLSRALMLCNRKETDGHVPKAALGRIGSDHGPGKRRKIVGRLIEVGFLHEPGHDCPSCPDPIDGWQVHDYPDYQPTRAKLEADRQQRRDAGRRGGLAKGKRTAKRAVSEPLSEPEANGLAKSKPGPVPEPVPEPQGQTHPSADADVDASFDRFWQAYPRGKAGKPGGDGARKPAMQKWRRLTDDQRRACLVAVEHYRTHVESPDGPIAAHALTWLNQERWEDWQEPARPETNGKSRTSPSGVSAFPDGTERF